VIHEPGGYERWLDQASNILETMPLDRAGERLFRTRGCNQCHSVEGGAKVGPNLGSVYGGKRVLADGSTVVADENYLRESILDPQARVAAGFEPVMPTYKGRLEDREITAIIAYLKSLAAEEEAGHP